MKHGPGSDTPAAGIVIITAGCCIPGLASLDESAYRIVNRALEETGVSIEVRTMSASTAYAGGAPEEVLSKLVEIHKETGRIALPVVLVNGKAISFGVPGLEQVKEALIREPTPKSTRT